MPKDLLLSSECSLLHTDKLFRYNLYTICNENFFKSLFNMLKFISQLMNKYILIMEVENVTIINKDCGKLVLYAKAVKNFQVI